MCSHDGMIHEMLCLASSSTNKGQFAYCDRPTDWQKDTLIAMRRCEEKYHLDFLIDSMALRNLYLMKNINYHHFLRKPLMHGLTDGRANECSFQWMNRPPIEIRGGPQGEQKGLLMPTQPL